MVNTTVPLIISRVLNTGTTLAVQGTAYAEMKANSAGCIIALNTAGTGITMTGATSISAAACAVDSNNSDQRPLRRHRHHHQPQLRRLGPLRFVHRHHRPLPARP